jgi:hypothetical protein
MNKTKSMEAVIAQPIGGVVLTRHPLEVEAARLAGLTRRLGKRLMYRHRRMLADAVPDEDWRESYKLYRDAVLGLLKEQRERARLPPGSRPPTVSDEDFEREIKALAAQAVQELPQDELDRLLEDRRALSEARKPKDRDQLAAEPWSFSPPKAGQ